MILGVHHSAISVPDIAKAKEFYCDALGFEPVMEAELPSGLKMMDDAMGLEDSSCKLAMLKKGNSCIELFEFNSPDTPEADVERPVNKHGITHICLVADDYQADYEHLEKAGVAFYSPMGAAPGRWAYGRDPFGNVVELIEHNPESPASIAFES